MAESVRLTAPFRVWIESSQTTSRLDEMGPSIVDFRKLRESSRPEFEAMAQRRGVEISEAWLGYRDAIREAAVICLHCHNVRRCRRWLSGGVCDDPRLFCRNTPLFELISERQRNMSARRGFANV